MQKNKKYIAVAHNCIVVDKNSKLLNENYPECKKNNYTLRDWYKGIYPGQSTTVMYRNPKYTGLNWSLALKNLSPGDVLTNFLLVSHGDVYCMQDAMSAYRHVITDGNSFSATHKVKYEEWKNYNLELVKYAKNYCDSQGQKYAEMYCVREYLSMLKHRVISLKEFFVLKNYGIHITKSIRYIILEKLSNSFA